MIRLEAASKRYRGRRGEFTALRGVDLTVRRGEVFAVIGPSGAGKSTLIRLINLLERPDNGRVIIDGEDVTNLGASDLRLLRRRMGMIFQDFGLLSSRTVAGNVALPLRLARRPAAETAERVDMVLDRVGLGGFAKKYPAELSGGQRQRVGIARALATSPDVLLCDEATSALDPQTTRSILHLLLDLNEELGLTMLLVTHEMDVVRQICDRVAVLDQGRVVESGTVSEVFLHPQHATTQRLVWDAGHEPDADALPPMPGRRVVRLTCLGEPLHAHLLSQISSDTGVDLAILAGRVSRIKNTPCSQLTLALAGGDTAEALRRFEAARLRVEVA